MTQMCPQTALVLPGMHSGISSTSFTSAVTSLYLLLIRLLGKGSLRPPACGRSRVLVQDKGSTLVIGGPWGVTAMLPTTLDIWAPKSLCLYFKSLWLTLSASASNPWLHREPQTSSRDLEERSSSAQSSLFFLPPQPVQLTKCPHGFKTWTIILKNGNK